MPEKQPQSQPPHHGRSMSWAFVGGEKGQLRSKLKKRFPSNLKLHYNEVVDLSEKFSRRFFSRSHGSYHVQREYQNYARVHRPSDSWVTVHNLRQLDGGILDPDDRLHDVADDREQIIAIYDEATKPQQGDGTSASDESENHSPNIFKCTDHKFEPFSRNGIEITGEELNGSPSPLHVRRGSEPALNRLSPIPSFTNIPLDPSKRWSAAPVIEDQAPTSSTPLKDQGPISSPYEDTAFEGYPGERGEGSGEEKVPSSLSASSSASSHHSATTTALSRFSRDGNRCSVQILSDNPNMARWAEAADRVIEAGGFFGKSEGMRREPLGGSSTPRHSREHSLEDTSRPNTLICLINDGTPLGIHVIPSTDRSGSEQGLLVEGIEPDGRVARDGRISVHDIIIEINDQPLRNVTFQRAQEIFKAAMIDPELQLLLNRKDNRSSPIKMVQVKEKLGNGNSRIANVTQTRKTPSITLSSRTQAVMLHSNTRKIGRRLTVNLVKGPHGLGFSITTRDNPAGGEAPIYIKNILPKGAAIEDGTLRIGDRLLEVNGVQVTGYSQSEVANLLRQIPVGGIASLIVSRQEKIEDSLSAGIEYEDDITNANLPPSPKLPRQLPLERATEDSLMFPWKQREILTFEIPVHDSERAGLGVSVKGKTSSGPNGSVDLGIFVKNVIHGGAASRDGRLRQNDQLVNINGLSLLGKSNSEAMKTLRTAMHQEYGMRLLSQQSLSLDCGKQSHEADLSMLQQEPKSLRNAHALPSNCSQTQELVVPTPGKITLLVARRVEGSHRDFKMHGMHASDNSGTSEASDNTVIFNKKDMDIDRSIEGCLDFGNLDSFQMNNPVIQRLTGNGNMALRNESYYKATHDTWSSTQMQQPMTPLSEKERLTYLGGPLEKFSSPTVNPPSRDTVLIHEEYDSSLRARRGSEKAVVPVNSSEGVYSEQHKPIDSYNSLTSLDESGVGFSRDQFGRQSMSEKRHATLDAKNTDTYQRNKKAREEREKQRQEMYAEMGINGENHNTTTVKGVREVPIDVPSNVDSSPQSNNLNIKSNKVSDDAGKQKPKNQFQKLNSPTKNDANARAMERLKHLAKLTDLNSYTGKSLTLQPSYMQRQSENNNTQLRSLRSPSSKFNTIHGENKSNKVSNNGNNIKDFRNAFEDKSQPQLPKCTPNAVINSRAKEPKRAAKSATATSTFGQELSAIIHSWALRNRELLGQNGWEMPLLIHYYSSADFLTRPKCGVRRIETGPPECSNWGVTRGLNKSSKEVGPGLGMRKSSSLESLQTMVQEMALEDEGQRAGSGRVPRGRGCNESFRAAVDRSYDAPLSGGANTQMETYDGYEKCYVTEEESESSGSGFGRGNSRQSSVSSSAEEKLKKGNKKRQGIFKGLGSMFRFGKHRKGGLDQVPNLAEEGQMEIANEDGQRLETDGQHHQQDILKNLMSENIDPICPISGISLLDEEGQSRSERMHQLRAEHQRRHVQRNGIYPTDDIEERYDHAIKQVMGDINEQQLDKANNNIINASIDTLNSTRVISSEVSNSVLINQTSVVSNHNIASPLSTSVVSSNSYASFSSNNNISNSSSQSKTKNKSSNRNSLYVSCIRAPRHSPSPPNSPTNFFDKESKENLFGSFLCTNSISSESRRHSLHIEVNHKSEISNAIVNQHLANEIRGHAVHKNVYHKPPLPPRNRPLNNNYKPPLPPPNPKPASLVSANGESFIPSNSDFPNSNLNTQQNSSLETIIGPEFAFTFSKPLPPCPDNGNFADKRRWSIVEKRSIDDVEAQNIANQTQSDLCSSVYSQRNGFPFNCNEDYQYPLWNRGNNINRTAGSINQSTDLSYVNRGFERQHAITSQPLSSSSSSGSSNCSAGSVRTNSLPRMGLKGKTAAKLCRSSPGPPPVPPPKGLPNILAPLRSTEVLEKSQFWRMDTMPPEPKAEIQHLRSRSYDVYGDGKDSRRQGKFADPNKFSHYVNYEQIQMHLRKNKEQERLAKLASQQYQDFRDKQTRRGLQGDEFDKPNNLITKLEQTFIHESIVASREQREYQSQRCAREKSYEQRPVSNYFEYESVQAMMNHAQSNPYTSSLSRRPQQPLPHHQQRNPHPPQPSSSGNPQSNFSSGANKNANNSLPKNHGQGRIVHPQPLFSHQRGQPTPPPSVSREGVYAASGFRPASQYNTANSYHHKPLLAHSNHSLTVPGSKV